MKAAAKAAKEQALKDEIEAKTKAKQLLAESEAEQLE